MKKGSIALVAAAVTLVMGMSVGIANAAGWMSGNLSCANHSAGWVQVQAKGSGFVRGPGVSSRYQRYFNHHGYYKWVGQSKKGQGGGSWNAYASNGISAASAWCIRGNF